jgi:hypothetical protein
MDRAHVWGYLLTAVLSAVVAAWMPACGGDESCPGAICTGCGAFGDCPDLDCAADQNSFCVAFPFGELDSGQRCAFCESPDFELP